MKRGPKLIARLEEIRQKLWERHRAAAPLSGCIPVGGGEWVDTFFRLEAIDGCLRVLRAGRTLSEAVSAGKEASREAVKKWNQRREYQVHRWEETAFDWLDTVIRLLTQETLGT
jgi:hypothetical protein